MDTAAFLRALPGCYGGDLRVDHPRERTFAPIAEQVPGWTTENGLALLNLAAAHLEAGEAYLEVGTFKGRSIAGAAHGRSHGTFYAVENFREFFMDEPGAKEALLETIGRWTPPGRVRLLEGDAFALLAERGAVAEPIGVFFYDGAHERLAHYLALGVVEQHLADEALVVVDDASWPLVAAATRRYVERHPGWELLLDIAADHEDDPRWHNGVWVLRYRRPAGTRREIGFDVRWRLALYLRVVGPAMGWAWRFFPRHPRLAGLAMRVVPQTRKNVPARPAGAAL
jgi:predicted O-methyltransferase YrrM